MNQELFAERLEACFRARGYDKRSFAEALGMTEKQLEGILRDASRLKLSKCVEIVDLLDVRLGFLAGVTDEPPDYLYKSESDRIPVLTKF